MRIIMAVLAGTFALAQADPALANNPSDPASKGAVTTVSGVGSLQRLTQNYPVTGITISLPSPPDRAKARSGRKADTRRGVVTMSNGDFESRSATRGETARHFKTRGRNSAATVRGRADR
jgi:hypothetical protein